MKKAELAAILDWAYQQGALYERLREATRDDYQQGKDAGMAFERERINKLQEGYVLVKKTEETNE